ILVSYALAGMIVVFARRMKPLSLILLGLPLIALSGLLYAGSMSLLNLVPEGQATGVVATPEQLEEIVSAYQSGFVDRLGYNALQAVFAQLGTLFMFGGRLVGVMLIGMALFKTGFLTARWSVSAYAI